MSAARQLSPARPVPPPMPYRTAGAAHAGHAAHAPQGAAASGVVPTPRRALPGTRPQRAAEPAARPRLTVVAPPVQERGRVPFVMVCIAVLVAALLGSLALNTTMARDAYAAHDLQIEAAELAQRADDLTEQLDAKASPRELARSARQLGMVLAPSVGFVQLKDSTVAGRPDPAVGEKGTG